MLLLAGLVGMMAVGSLAFVGMSEDEEDDADAECAEETPTEEHETGAEGQGVIDFAGRGDAPRAADPEERDAGADPEAEEGTSAGAEDTIGAPDGPDVAADPESEDADATGAPGPDRMRGGDGPDRIEGGAGDDELLGGAGDDSLSGGDGDDTLNGGEDDDALTGGAGLDTLYGNVGDDVMEGGAGDDSLHGGAGDDTLAGDDGDDALHGGLGDDALDSGAGRDTLFGGWGDDTLSGLGDGADFLNGGGGDDMITAGAGDMVTGGEGADTVALGDWLNGEHQAQILDFATEEDNLMVIFDDIADPDPEVAIERDEDDANIRHLVLNGARIAAVHGAPGLTLGHVTLMGQSVLAEGAAA
ncbi:calcium-binding protein [Roseovarius spongiae]|uniref:Calcium-binding protein n=1 Tax=Roseovarius spongiae TaxID=2320272 RepID=A0A3A8BAK7_9RHOB|nr:calcium-binding protein [Roseovarius spongiae]RKF16202.1 calcium-binding protein [Roseovarius spongiae]